MGGAISEALSGAGAHTLVVGRNQENGDACVKRITDADGSAEFVGDGGLPIGLVDEARYDRQSLQLGSGDRFLLYTDGFSEAVMKDGAMLDEDGLLRLVRETAQDGCGTEFLDDLFWRLTLAMDAETGLQDDVSATLLEFDVL